MTNSPLHLINQSSEGRVLGKKAYTVMLVRQSICVAVNMRLGPMSTTGTMSQETYQGQNHTAPTVM